MQNRRWVRLPLRFNTLILLALGVALLVIGIWVEEREAVAAPLVIIGALVALIAIVYETWADVAEMSVSDLRARACLNSGSACRGRRRS